MIREEFGHINLNQDGIQASTAIAEAFSEFLTELEEGFGKDGHCQREWALVRTKMQEACFYSKKAVSLIPHYQYIKPEVVK